MSRPERDHQPPGKKLSPTVGDLEREQKGFAVRRTAALVRQLHGWARTSPPAWLQEP